MKFSRITLLFAFAALSAARPNPLRTVSSLPQASLSLASPPSMATATSTQSITALAASISTLQFLLPTSSTTFPSLSTSTLPQGVPTITPAPPTLVPGKEGVRIQEKWHLTTYYTCVTIGGNADCGWHEPVLPGGDEIAEGRSVSARQSFILLGFAAGAAVIAVGRGLW